ncbi:FMN-binding protein [Dactylosporangium sp. CA-139066]|uniref:FMN-binding protein n=1 Tax=Dactylosporangium sp. CA-139066 TaxID=3239930 RepID=UPI003D89DF1D
MRRITFWLLSTLAALALVFSYRTSLGSTAPAPATTAVGTAGAAGTSGNGTTYQGSAASTRWGDVQVSITVADGKITAVSVPVYPNENGKDQQINARALPILVQETIAAQNADIDTVSGATVTSNGYKESLQAALDAAHLS